MHMTKDKSVFKSRHCFTQHRHNRVVKYIATEMSKYFQDFMCPTDIYTYGFDTGKLCCPFMLFQKNVACYVYYSISNVKTMYERRIKTA